jgi:hypothetical protein
VLALIAALAAPGLWGQDPENHASLDLYLFNQEDNGANPFVNEEFLYFGGRMAARLKVSDLLTIRPTVAGSHIATGRTLDVPDTVTNANVAVRNATTTSASDANVTVSSMFDITPEDTEWKVSPGFLFTYQPNFVSRGVDLGVSAELFGGDFVPSFNYGFRWDSFTGGNLRIEGIFDYGLPTEISESGVDRRLHRRLTHNFQVGFTQNLSPRWVLGASFQFTRQDGYLSEPNAKVMVYDDDTPVFLAEDRLPNNRNRFQLNLRVRFSPADGYALGVDHSGYADDWGIINGALEPSAEGLFGTDVARWRVWYRISYQQGTRYLRDKPQREFDYQTADSDLGTFNTHGGGAVFLFELPRIGPVEWVIRVSMYGMVRSDHLWGLGWMLGTEVGW